MGPQRVRYHSIFGSFKETCYYGKSPEMGITGLGMKICFWTWARFHFISTLRLSFLHCKMRMFVCAPSIFLGYHTNQNPAYLRESCMLSIFSVPHNMLINFLCCVIFSLQWHYLWVSRTVPSYRWGNHGLGSLSVVQSHTPKRLTELVSEPKFVCL